METPKHTKLFQVRWAEKLGEPSCPYVTRWVFIFLGFSLRVHHFVRSDDKRYMHDHGWWFLTMVLNGSYTDVSPDGSDKINRFGIRFRPAKHRHYVDVPKGGCWTVLITGRPMRNWGFWVNGKFRGR